MSKMENIDISLPKEKKRIDLSKIAPHRMEHILLTINVLVLVSIIAIIMCFMLFGKRPTKSDEENRNLAECPSFSLSAYFDGSFTAQFSEYFNDTVPMRSTFKRFISDFRAHLGIPYDDGIKLIGNIPTQQQPDEQKPTVPATETTAMTTETTVTETSATTVDTNTAQTSETQTTTTVTTTETTTTTTTATTEAEAEEDFDGEIANNILIVKDRGLMLYGGSKERGQAYAETLNQYKAELGDAVNIYSLVAPTAVSYYLPKKFADYSASEAENIESINSFLDGVTPVDAFSILEKHKKEAIYSRTDHHWQPLGAYYAAKAFAETADVPFAELSEYETVEKEGYVGTLYGYTNDAVFKDNPEPFVYYVPQNEFVTTYYNSDMTNERQASLLLNLENVPPSSWYLVFMGGDDRITHITTDCTNDRKLVIIKDSYGNAIVPCLTQSFSEIWVIDMRYFEPSAIEFIKQNGITDVLFAMNTFSATGENSKKLQSIMY